MFVDEPKLSVRKMECSRPMTDLDDEAQTKIEQMMYDDHRKKLGLPTHQEQVGLLILLYLYSKDFTARKYCCGKVMFLHLCVILFWDDTTPRADTLPWTDIFPRAEPPPPPPPARYTPLPSRHPPWADTPSPPPPETATAVDDMHPSGMHSCFSFLRKISSFVPLMSPV